MDPPDPTEMVQWTLFDKIHPELKQEYSDDPVDPTDPWPCIHDGTS
jgi:hypothetical protein